MLLSVRRLASFLVPLTLAACSLITETTPPQGQTSSSSSSSSSSGMAGSTTGAGGGAAGMGGSGIGGTAGAGTGGGMAGAGGGMMASVPKPEFALADVNPNSKSYTTNVSPSQFLGRVSAWYFGHST